MTRASVTNTNICQKSTKILRFSSVNWHEIKLFLTRILKIFWKIFGPCINGCILPRSLKASAGVYVCVLFTVSMRKMISCRRCRELVNVPQNSAVTVIDLVLAPLKSRTLQIDKRMAVLSSNCREGVVSCQP